MNITVAQKFKLQIEKHNIILKKITFKLYSRKISCTDALYIQCAYATMLLQIMHITRRCVNEQENQKKENRYNKIWNFNYIHRKIPSLHKS